VVVASGAASSYDRSGQPDRHPDDQHRYNYNHGHAEGPAQLPPQAGVLTQTRGQGPTQLKQHGLHRTGLLNRRWLAGGRAFCGQVADKPLAQPDFRTGDIGNHPAGAHQSIAVISKLLHARCGDDLPPGANQINAVVGHVLLQLNQDTPPSLVKDP